MHGDDLQVLSVAVSAERLALALERMGPGDWSTFERFAAEFLAVEYPSLRTTASPRGDRGRDGQMYAVDDEPHTVVQYSVATDWAAKIGNTLRRLSDTFPSVKQVIYATNQVIGPDADDLVARLRRTRRIALDIKDRSWFVERERTHPQREAAAEELARRFVDPLLVERGVRSFAATALENEEARVAVVHLALEGEDEATGKGWTKRSYEALVLSALHDTSPDTRLTREQIIERVQNLLPAGHDTQISELVAGALRRLSRRRGPVKDYAKSGSYALSYEERERLQGKLTAFALGEEELKAELVATLRVVADHAELSDADWARLADDLRFGLDTVLLKRGEVFARAVATGEMQQVNAQDILAAITAAGRASGSMVRDEEVASAVMEVLQRPLSQLRMHLCRLADAYTMYSFLRQTPDVQKALLRVFRGGEIWLDTTVVLPLLAEELLENPEHKHYTTIFRAALDAGLKLFVTDGVIEELDSHLRLCLAYSRAPTGVWRSNVPFVYSAYALAGHPRHGFAGWLETFRGAHRPIDDLREYLAEVHAIDRRNLTDVADGAPTELRAAVQEIWYEVHERRRSRPGSEVDIENVRKLVAHDVENCVGVIQLRSSTTLSPVGHHQWFLTLDKAALFLKRKLADRLESDAPDSPALSPDFMAQYLHLAPVRTAVERELWVSLPLLTDISRYELVPRDLIDRADELRRELGGVDERIARRRVRDQMDRMKLKQGPEALAGVRGMGDRLIDRLRAQAAPGQTAGSA